MAFNFACPVFSLRPFNHHLAFFNCRVDCFRHGPSPFVGFAACGRFGGLDGGLGSTSSSGHASGQEAAQGRAGGQWWQRTVLPRRHAAGAGLFGVPRRVRVRWRPHQRVIGRGRAGLSAWMSKYCENRLSAKYYQAANDLLDELVRSGKARQVR